MKKIYETTIGGRPFRVEIGEVAKQALASCLVYYGDTTVLSTVTAKENNNPLQDFFPLMVIYQERLYAAGKIPGGFLRREGRPSEHETLTSRLIDRPLRPLFPEYFYDEVQVVNTVLSSDENCSSEMASLIGSSIVLTLSNLPFDGPVASVIVGLIGKEYIINPTVEQFEKTSLNLTLAGTKDAINMVEAGAQELTEKQMLDAILFGHEEIKKIVSFIEKIKEDNVVTKKEVNHIVYNENLVNELAKNYSKKIKDTLLIFDKLERQNGLDNLKEEIVNLYEEQYENKGLFVDEETKLLYINEVKLEYEKLVQVEFRKLITIDKIRPDGRKVTEIRPLSSRVDILPRTHGSSLFTRGQTQALGVVTLGSLAEKQIVDDLSQEDEKRFLLHYNFPPFSVGETGRYGSPGRREIGHGALARRAIEPMLPDEDIFPYTIRVVSEILESNGSSSMATVCTGTLSLMAAGVPMKKPVAGIAMGLIKEGKKYTILTDIQGMEDHLGDMDFKVAGTKDGITALQMDIKISGINEAILKEALNDAKLARMQLLEHMATTLKQPRTELSEFAPKVKMIRISPDKIKDVIGSGGKVIQDIIEKCNQVKIDIEQDGRVYIMHNDYEWLNKAVKTIENLTKEVEIGQIYEGKVVRIEKFGAFVELWPGCEGLVHISKLSSKKVEKVEDIVKLNDQILVKAIQVDEKGRLDLSRKDAIKE